MKNITTKMVNIMTICLVFVFIMSATLAVFSTIEEYNQSILDFQELVSDTDQFNFNHTVELSDGLTDAGESEQNMFNNGADAFMHAYYGYADAESYHVVTRGTSTNKIVILGKTIEMTTQSQNNMIKYKDGSAIYQLISYEPGGKYKRSSSTYIYYNKPNETIYLRETDSVSKVGGELIPNYKTSWIFDSVDYFENLLGMTPGKSIYDFSKDAVLQESFAEIPDERTGKLAYYKTEIKTNPAWAGGPYLNVIKYIGQAKTASIQTMKETAKISPTGELLELRMQDEFTVTTEIFLIGEKEVKCTSDSVYDFVSVGEDVLFERPDVSDAKHS